MNFLDKSCHLIQILDQIASDLWQSQHCCLTASYNYDVECFHNLIYCYSLDVIMLIDFREKVWPIHLETQLVTNFVVSELSVLDHIIHHLLQYQFLNKSVACCVVLHIRLTVAALNWLTSILIQTWYLTSFRQLNESLKLRLLMISKIVKLNHVERLTTESLFRSRAKSFQMHE